ncbi:hypothetical protein CYY_010202 [Polysphondylium violaceum]|uniref:NADPH-dependent diflavin oxidoreductase 1 n=1 Tax=Polysphondylium violaceum TaxID=133409 RepID=A0A8J4UU15_9MYCE|nr:hypothetical protein CYY_010202 [Polysphondylium violaceum]
MNKCTIIYATETGTSQEVAEKLSRDLIRYQMKPQIHDIQNYDKMKLPMERLVVFVLSTTGHGDVPDTMKPFWNFLLIKSLPSNSLMNLKFAVLGMGDSSYTTYNFAAKKLFTRLVSLGAKPLLRRGDADDQHDLGYDYEVEKWTSELIQSLLTIYPLPPNLIVDDNNLVLPNPKFKLNYSNQQEKDFNNNNFITNNYEKTIVQCNKRITDSEWEQDIRHIELKLDKLNYKSGDVAYILPTNPISYVDEFINLLQLNRNQIIESIIPLDLDLNQKPNVIVPTSVGELVYRYFDIMGSPRRYFFQLLSHFVSDENEKERLLFFSSSEGQDDLRTYNQKEKRNYIDVLKDFPSANIPLEYLFDLIPPIKPRPFSISSSSSLYPKTISITAGIHTFKAPLRRIKRTGLCSEYFSSLQEGSIVGVFIKESGAQLPPSPQTPIIMVGPGTGCAMFRSFIQERSYVQQNQGSDKLGKALFYFGCRHSKKDYIYQSEFEQYEKDGVISKLCVAFSRDQEKKNYVYHLINQDSKEIWDIINNQKGYFYISGSSGRMPKDVKASLLSIIKENLGIVDGDDDKVNQYFEQLEIEKRFITETW